MFYNLLQIFFDDMYFREKLADRDKSLRENER